MGYIKYAITTVKMNSNWGRVYYTNFWASIILFFMTLYLEPQTLVSMEWSYTNVGALVVSCAIGTAMSYFAFLCRAAVSATSFTVIGNVCKIITVLINIFMWDKHASPLGIICLLACLVAAGAYQQAPLRAKQTTPIIANHPEACDKEHAPLVSANVDNADNADDQK